MMIQKHDATNLDTSSAQDAARTALGLMLVIPGTSHLTFAREPFKAQVPPWVSLGPDTVVLQSGVVEIGLGAALLLLPRQKVLSDASQAIWRYALLICCLGDATASQK